MPQICPLWCFLQTLRKIKKPKKAQKKAAMPLHAAFLPVLGVFLLSPASLFHYLFVQILYGSVGLTPALWLPLQNPVDSRLRNV
jgi:hypothetical protein